MAHMPMLQRQVLKSIIIALLFITGEAWAAAPSPGGDCSTVTANFTTCYSDGCYTCVSNVWVPDALMIGQSGLTCSSTYAGMIRWNNSGGYHEMCDGSAWRQLISTPAQSDVTPNSFSFTDLTDQPLSALVNSNAPTITGFDGTLTATVSGGGNPEISINGGGWASSGGIQSGQTIRVRLTSSGSVSDELTATVVIGGTSADWHVTTRAGNTRIFLTGATHTGNVGGLLGADGICQAEAAGAGYSGFWQALLSDSLVNAGDRLSITYPVIRASDAATVAATDLWGGSLSNAVGGWANTWTNTNADGTRTSSSWGTCGDWTSGSGAIYGYWGATAYTSSSWVKFNGGTADNCDHNDYLYCIEQPSVGCSVNAFSFTDATNVAVSTLTTSNTIAPSGCASDSTVFVAGDGSPQVSINGGGWTTRGTLNSGNTLAVRLTSSVYYGTTYKARIFIGATVSTWNVTTSAGGNKVFLTSSSYLGGAMGGLSGADALCQSQAGSLGFSGTYKAILSDESTDARDRLTLTYPIVRAYDGVVVASTNLWVGSLDNPIYPWWGFYVWTGTAPDGTKYSGWTCNSWTDSSYNGGGGGSSNGDSQWTAGGDGHWVSPCGSNEMNLYCISQ